jgi:hypothetical protein
MPLLGSVLGDRAAAPAAPTQQQGTFPAQSADARRGTGRRRFFLAESLPQRLNSRVGASGMRMRLETRGQKSQVCPNRRQISRGVVKNVQELARRASTGPVETCVRVFTRSPVGPAHAGRRGSCSLQLSRSSASARAFHPCATAMLDSVRRSVVPQQRPREGGARRSPRLPLSRAAFAANARSPPLPAHQPPAEEVNIVAAHDATVPAVDAIPRRQGAGSTAISCMLLVADDGASWDLHASHPALVRWDSCSEHLALRHGKFRHAKPGSGSLC